MKEITNSTLFRCPAEANFSPIMSMLSLDVNEDGLKDIVIGGNFYGFTPGMGIQDASHGLLLVNKGSNEFEPIEHNQSGIMMEGQIRDMDWITLSNGSTALIVARNNKSPMLFKMRKEVIPPE